MIIMKAHNINTGQANKIENKDYKNSQCFSKTIFDLMNLKFL